MDRLFTFMQTYRSGILLLIFALAQPLYQLTRTPLR